MLLEAEAGYDQTGESLPFSIEPQVFPWVIDTRPMIRQIADRVSAGELPSGICRDFQETISEVILETCSGLRERTKLDTVCLSGGTFQSACLLRRTIYRLTEGGFRVFTHSQVPTNDGGISLGQAAILAKALQEQ